MNCNCNLLGFSYENLERVGKKFQKVRVTKCGVLPIDGKKKKKCDFYNKDIIKTDIYIEKPVVIKFKPAAVHYNGTPEEVCRKDIAWNIYLCNIAVISPIINRGKYYELINYNLRKLKYKTFFEERETLDELIIRLRCPPDNNPKYKHIKSIHYIVNKKQSNQALQKYGIEDPDEVASCKSDDDSSGSDMESINDMTFDVEDCDSVDEDDNDGAFSD
jgi:hypothetical protein|tara:strand:+ start:476 stop:1126 length:651 start_codon:yes stop_codon:yes gene_type:complete